MVDVFTLLPVLMPEVLRCMGHLPVVEQAVSGKVEKFHWRSRYTHYIHYLQIVCECVEKGISRSPDRVGHLQVVAAHKSNCC